MATMGIGADGMLPGPPGRENGGCADCTPKGLFAYGAGSSVVVVDIRSMQLVTVLPMPPQSTAPLLPAPFVTSMRWTPQPMQRDLLTQELSTAHLRLAVGDRQGRIAVWDAGARQVTDWLTFDSPDRARFGIQDLCWLRAASSLLMAIHGQSLVAIWNVTTGRCIWKYDASPEILTSVRQDPFDFRHVCVLGLRGTLLSVRVAGEGEGDVSVKEYRIQLGDVGHLKGDKDGSSTAQNSAASPASALFPGVFVRCMFSSRWAHIIYAMFPREIVVFDLQYGTALSVTGLPRGCAKYFDVIADVDGDLLYCAHADGRVSLWKRNEGKQTYVLCMLEALMPLLGTSVPSPTLLAVSYCSSEVEIEKTGRMHLEKVSGVKPFELPSYSEKTASSMLSRESGHVLETCFISISDDGKVWKWLLTAEVPGDMHSQVINQIVTVDSSQGNGNELSTDTGVDGHSEVENKSSQQLRTSIYRRDEIMFQLKLIGQLHLLSSAITTLAVPAPSLTGTMTGGGNGPAVAVPLVAVATQGGCIEVVDVAATAVTTSFAVHNSAIRGLRWLGNSRLVSFSYTQVNEKGGGYINRLAVTCVRSGISRFFRVLQKPERAPMRALRASPSGRYLLILFREAPVEVWAMTRNPQMLRSLALPFTVMEWALPPVPKPVQKAPRQSSYFAKERPTIASTVAAANAQFSDSKSGTSEGSAEEMGENFAFALVNGSVGVFEVRGRRVRDFRPKWPTSSFVSPDVLVTAMAYRMPHVVMGDRIGSIRWWDVTSGLSSSFNTHRGGIRRIKFAPFVWGDYSRGRVAVLFNDNTFSIYDLDTQDPLANAILQPQFAGILVMELDWFPLRLDKKEPLLLCIAGADSSFRLLEVNTQSGKSVQAHEGKPEKDRFRPMPLCSPALLPLPHALALRMLLQWGVQPAWFDAHKSANDMDFMHIPGMPSNTEQRDLRHYMLETSFPVFGDSVVPELLLKILEPYRRAGRLLDNDRVRTYAALLDKGCTTRFAFAAAHFGEFSEALFWLQLPHILFCLTEKIHEKSLQHAKHIEASPEQSTSDGLHIAKPAREILSLTERKNEKSNSSALGLQDSSSLSTLRLPYEGSDVMPSDQGAFRVNALQRISWHEKLGGEDASQNRVHELVAVGDLETAVTLLISTPSDSPYFYIDSLRAIALSSAVSPALHELAVKVVAANMVGTDHSLSGTHLLCAVGCYQEACSQLQDAGCWTDAATLAASHLQGSDYSRVLQRWADHVLNNEHNIWRALILYATAGALHKALEILRDSQQPDTAAMFLAACHETKAKLCSQKSGAGNVDSPELHVQDQGNARILDLPGDLNQRQEDVLAVCEYYGHYQRTLVHLCTDQTSVLD